MMPKRILLTGGAGFIGAHVAQYLLDNTDCELIMLDRLDCSGNLNRLTQITGWDQYRKRCKWVYHDLKAPINAILAAQIGKVDIILHLAAATHVDRSIEDPLSFVYDNVVGTCNLLDYARHSDTLKQFIYFSTDEVFGPAPPGVKFKEWDPYHSSNPYSATKAGAEELCIAFANTYKLPVIVTHTMNVFGERQHPEKFIPMTIRKVLNGDTVFIHADPTKTKASSRFYIHAQNVASALSFLFSKAEDGEKYNIVGEKEVDNLQLAQLTADIMGQRLHYEMVDFHTSRPGHDLRYALDGSKMESIGWVPTVNFEKSLENTINWTLKNQEWLAI